MDTPVHCCSDFMYLLLALPFAHSVHSALGMPIILNYCSFWQCAMLSPTFKVRDIDVEDATPYPIHFSWNSTTSDETGCVYMFHSYKVC